ncbi:hypothetical protein C8R43DRAFT_613577 [Mycena crocata]|nr:hypothetical protein C8R43DRAFT_613577 [Mycena crocata]
MPGRVRFSPTNTSFHSSVPPLMSPLGSSPPSSRGPLTPPTYGYTELPRHTSYPSQRPRSHSYSSAGRLRAHNLLAYSNTPLLNYDISSHPSSISTHFAGISSTAFHEPAVHPSQSSITLVTPYLPWAIPVAASNGRYVTVSDVLHAVYCSLRTNVTHTEFQALGTAKHMRRVTDAYTQRYERFRGHRAYGDEKRQGVRRVDFLMNCTMLQGISPTSNDPHVWQLHIR